MSTAFNANTGARKRRPRRERIDRLWEAEEANPGALAIGILSPDGALLEGGLIQDRRPIMAGAQDLLKEPDLPRLVAGMLPGECAVDRLRWQAGSLRQEECLPEYPGRRDGNPPHAAIHRPLG
jgi:hypothetical protein